MRASSQDIRWRHIGPDGNRAIAVAGEPGNAAVMYVGAASGGIFKTENGGISWTSIFDSHEVSAVGSLAIAPGHPNIVWAGTDETFLIRPPHAIGNGIYRSDDAGKTWTRMGLEKTGRIGRVVIHPSDPKVVFACALGHAFGPQPERGVYRTTDGGKTWEQVLKVDEKTGCADIAIDVNNPQVLFAGMWPLEINTWGLRSGGPGGGVYVSRDGGTTWRKLAGRGLPPAGDAVGKTAVAVEPSDSRRVYGLIEQKTPTLYRSDDGGETLRIVNRNHVIAERASYYTRFAVSPDDPNRLYVASVSWSVSVDGGETLHEALEVAGPSGRKDQIEYDIVWDHKPPNGDIRTMGSVDDGGLRLHAADRFAPGLPALALNLRSDRIDAAPSGKDPLMTATLTTLKLPMPMRMGNVNAYLLHSEAGFFLIDTGSSGAREQLLSELANAGCIPGSLRLVLLTHGDFDHTGNAAYLRSSFGVKLAMQRADSGMGESGDMFENRKRPNVLIRSLIPLFTGFGKEEQFSPDLLLEGGERPLPAWTRRPGTFVARPFKGVHRHFARRGGNSHPFSMAGIPDSVLLPRLDRGTVCLAHQASYDLPVHRGGLPGGLVAIPEHPVREALAPGQRRIPANHRLHLVYADRHLAALGSLLAWQAWI